MSTLAARRVRRVRLAAPRPELVRRGAVLLEDALHTASIPGGDGGRLLLVRRLEVGRIVPGRGPAALAAAVERRLREVEVHAVHADRDGAGEAPAVFFRDAAEAAALLAARVAIGPAPEAWFWRSAVPAWHPALGPAEGLRAVLRAAAAAPQGPAAVAEVARVVRRRGGIDALLAAVTPADASALLAAAGWSAPAAAPAVQRDGGDGDSSAPVLPRQPPPEWRPVLARWVAAWGSEDARALWLAATVLVAERPERAADPHLPQRAMRLVRDVAGEGAASIPAPRTRGEAALGAPSPHPPAAPDRSPDAGVAAEAESADPHPAAPEASARDEASAARPSLPVQPAGDEGAAAGDVSRSPSSSISPAVATSGHAAAGPSAEPSIEPPRHQEQRGDDEEAGEAASPLQRRGEVQDDADAGRATAGGGLFFLLAVMERLGIADFVGDHPALLDAGLPSRVLLRVAGHLGLGRDDPARRWVLEGVHAPEPGADLSFAAPDAWSRGVAGAGEMRPDADGRIVRDASGRLALFFRASGGADDVEVAVAAWVTALRRWCRRNARVGLADVVLRPARMAWTRTHLDVTLPLSALDVRVRAAGLDLDPGWVPWLGRVVAFHYE